MNSSFFDVLSLIGSILIIVLVIVLTYFASRWYARKMGVSGSGKHIKIIERVGLGQNAYVVIAEIDERYYLIGVSDKNIQLLSALEDFEPREDDPQAAGRASFSQLLNSMMQKSGKTRKKDDGGE